MGGDAVRVRGCAYSGVGYFRVERASTFGNTKTPRKSLGRADTSPSSRYLPAAVKRLVSERDGNRCTFVGRDGRRCTARERLEFHHDDPYALGGDCSPDNISLMCRAHNVYMAELDYGKDKMDRYRRSADCSREPLPALQLRLDGVGRTS